MDIETLRHAVADRFTDSDLEVISAAIRHYDIRIDEAEQFAAVGGHILAVWLEAQDAINEKWKALNGAPGAKTRPVQFASSGDQGYVQEYEHGAIFWRRDLGAWWVFGAIYAKYRALGAAKGFLGYPLTDETATSDGVGRFNHFQKGSIYWHPTIGAFEVHGDIRTKWQESGSERFGYPLTDETSTLDGRGRFNHFRAFKSDGTTADSSIFWTPETSAKVVYGAIRRRWAELGWERSYLGYPVSDEMDWTDPETQKLGRVNHFERGSMVWTSDDGTTEFPERRILRSGHIGVSSVGGWVELTLSSAGTFDFKGHLHNSGFVGLHCSVGAAVVARPGTKEVIAAAYEANVGGTTSIDGRDEDWHESGFKYEIRAYWEYLRDVNTMEVAIKAGLGAWEVVTLILLPIIGAFALIQLIAGGSPHDTTCSTSDWHTVKDRNNRTVYEPAGIGCRKTNE